MAEEEDDDESFGDFTFASFPNQPLPSTSNSNLNHTVSVEDDDWGDFVNHSNQINGGFSKPFHPFEDPTKKHVNGSNGIAAKPQGAIPLSIFGEDEEEEDREKKEEEPASAFVFSNSDAVKRGSTTNGSVGISDLISNLYNPRPQMNSHNGSVSITNVAAPNSNADGLMNSNESSLNSDLEEDDDGWEFKSAEWEAGIKSQNVKVMDQGFPRF